MTETIYHVRIRGPFVATKRVRAGITVSASDGYTGPLSKEQLEAIKADEVLAVGKPSDADDDNSTDTSAAQTQAADIVAKAEAQAAKLVDDAKAEAEKVKTEAREEAHKVVSDAKAEAEKVKAASKPSGK